MATAAIAHQVNDHILVELVTVVQCQLSHEANRLGIISINVEDRCLNHLGDIGTIFGGARIFLLGSGEAHLVVDHDVNGSASLVGTGL